ncbi:MAG: TlpA disulfide reductase family protein [Bacteroidota bacterium]
MIRSISFWLGAALLAVIPLLVMDIPKHYIDWTREVHDEMIVTVHNHYNLSKTEKADILDNILDANNTLMASMYLKGFAGAILLALSIYFFVRYSRTQNLSLLKTSGIIVVLLLVSVSVKVYSWTAFAGNANVRLLDLSTSDTTLTAIHQAHFKGKVVYVDFWGTTCGPCLEEFRNFTKPLKSTYSSRKDIEFLYISGGRKWIWKQQVQKLNVEGSHIFLNQLDYARMYHKAVNGNENTVIAMPRYVILDKTGTVADIDAPRPSDKDKLISKLNTYLNNNKN